VDLKAGQIVTVDWRKEPDDPAQDPQPPEPNKLRPAVVVPMTGDPALAIPDLTVVLQPSPSNGCKKVSYLLPQNLTCVAKSRITAVTKSQITSTELQQLRQLVVLSIGGLS
jgi:mRNA interferase MazF